MAHLCVIYSISWPSIVMQNFTLLIERAKSGRAWHLFNASLLFLVYHLIYNVS